MIIYKLIDILIGVKVSKEIEKKGLDIAIHGEENEPLNDKIVNII